jgi:hypothetical protein
VANLVLFAGWYARTEMTSERDICQNQGSHGIVRLDASSSWSTCRTVRDGSTDGTLNLIGELVIAALNKV